MPPPLRMPAPKPGQAHVTCDAEEPLAVLASRMRRAAADFAVVLRQGKVAGIVTARQIGMRLHAANAAGPPGRTLRAGNVMTFKKAAPRTPGLAR